MKGQCDEYEMKNILSDYYCETMVDISPSDALKKINSIFKDELKMPDFKMRFPEGSSSDAIDVYKELRNFIIDNETDSESVFESESDVGLSFSKPRQRRLLKRRENNHMPRSRHDEYYSLRKDHSKGPPLSRSSHTRKKFRQRDYSDNYSPPKVSGSQRRRTSRSSEVSMRGHTVRVSSRSSSVHLSDASEDCFTRLTVSACNSVTNVVVTPGQQPVQIEFESERPRLHRHRSHTPQDHSLFSL